MIANLLKDRNVDQVSSFVFRNWNSLSRNSKAYPACTNDQKKSLLAKVERCRKANDNVGTKWNTGSWTEKERNQLSRGIEVAGKRNYKSLSHFVKTRSVTQIRKYVYQHLREKDASTGTNDELEREGQVILL